MLLRFAYTREQLERMAAHSRFGGGEVASNGIACELRLTKRPETSEARGSAASPPRAWSTPPPIPAEALFAEKRRP
jgi:hypothetical protein